MYLFCFCILTIECACSIVLYLFLTMECEWKNRPSVEDLAEMVNNPNLDDDTRYIAALVMGSGYTKEAYDPNDPNDPDNFEYLSNPDPQSASMKMDCGQLLLLYSRQPGQPARIHARFTKQKSTTEYRADVSESEIGLYSCDCCIGRTRRIMHTISTLEGGAYQHLKSVKTIKDKMVLQFGGGYESAGTKLILSKVRPSKTIQFSTPVSCMYYADDIQKNRECTSMREDRRRHLRKERRAAKATDRGSY